MLENEPTGDEVQGNEPAAEAPATPVKRTRARKSTAAAAASDASPAADAADEEVPVRRRRKAASTPKADTEGESAAEGTNAAPVKRTRRRKAATEDAAPAERSADAVVAAESDDPVAEPAAGLGDVEPASGRGPSGDEAIAAESDDPAAEPIAGLGDVEPAAAPRGRTRSRARSGEATTTRSRRRATAGDVEPGAAAAGAPDADPGLVESQAPGVPGEPVDEEETTEATTEPLDTGAEPEEPAPRRRRAATVLFMAPEADEEPTPVRRTRRTRGTTDAAEPAAPAATTAAPSPEPEADEAESGEAAEGTSRRRRRGRRTAEEPAVVEADVAEEAEEAGSAVEADDDEDDDESARRRRRRGRRGRGRGKGPIDEADEVEEPAAAAADEDDSEDGDGVTRRRRRRRRKGDTDTGGDDGVHTVVRIREPRTTSDEVQGVSGSTRLEAKRQRRRDGREQRRTRPPILSESEFLARREAVDRVMVVRQRADRTQIAVLEDGVLVEHYVTRASSGAMAGNVYLGKVQNVLPSMEAAFVDVGRGRNAVLYAGEVNWDASGLEGRARSIEQALRSGDSVLVQVTKDPIGHKGARLTSHIALSGRHLVYVPGGNASGISRKLPDTERKRLRDVLKKLVPEGAGVIVRTAAEGASEDELERDVKRLQAQWDDIQEKAAAGGAPALLYEEPDLLIRVVRDLFNEDFREIVVQGDESYEMVESYLGHVSPDLVPRLHRHTSSVDLFAEKRIDEQILKGLDRKVFLPSGGHLVIDRTEAMTVVDVNTGKYTGAGGNLEETVTRNNLEAAEEIVRQLRLRDLGGIVVIDFIDMVLESNRELVLRRLTECLGRDRTKHQVTEITSLGLVQMTRKRIGAGLLEAFSETCDVCRGRGLIIHTEPVPVKGGGGGHAHGANGAGSGSGSGSGGDKVKAVAAAPATSSRRRGRKSAPAQASAPDTVEPTVVDEDDTMGYDLSRYDDVVLDPVDEVEAPTDIAPATNGRLAGADDPDAAGDEEGDLAEAGTTRRRGRRGGTRRRTRP
ncbi:Rne/Rng family ribonuclease [Asanoa sp. WMMD1127]|uniref:Rne/Rng family ribonuclease n=1 Tax=Asanoa sp. WMMD1127 TaxID=3016107 RepID=UPI002417C9B9|nr:Rne/Rng family ribonuclease [Asanoa sp. WMMD1127]MDG4827646.1 Rne/Rng family ribonuclease [Asanoa sp. WMMD1127]